jgi:hypothetical protein
MGVLNTNPNIRLIVIDPISSFLGNTPMNKEQEVRNVLNPLLKEAQKRKIAVVLVAHFNKNSETRSAIDRVGGAKAIVGLGRAAWTCVREPKDDSEVEPGEPMKIEDPERRMFLKLKGNLTPSSIGGLVYTIVTAPVEVETEDGKKEMVDTPFIKWLGRTESNAQDVVIDGKSTDPRKVKADASLQWLNEYLNKTGGSAWSDDVVEAGALRGYSARTLQRLAARLKLDLIRVGPHRQTQWVKPGALLQPETTAPPVKKARGGKGAVSLESVKVDVEPEAYAVAPVATMGDPDAGIEAF